MIFDVFLCRILTIIVKKSCQNELPESVYEPDPLEFTAGTASSDVEKSACLWCLHQNRDSHNQGKTPNLQAVSKLAWVGDMATMTRHV